MAKKFTGLTNEEVIKSKEEHGANVFEKEKSKGFFKRFFENINDPIIKVLIIALVIEVVFTFGHCNLFEVFGIVAAILIATVVSTVSELGSERAFERMQSESGAATVRVIRCGQTIEITAAEVVVGDLMIISSGEKIYADATIIDGKLSVDQSALNGESAEALKFVANGNEPWELSSNGKVFSGTVAILGDAVARVERVGLNTYYGMVARDIQAETRESPLKLRLTKFAAQISKIGYFMALLVALVYLFNAIIIENNFSGVQILASLKDFKGLFATLVHALTLMITVIVVAVPEGLPMMITVVLSANMKRMLNDNILVKKLVGIETAGSMNVLFTDKTGTITTGEPKIESIEGVDFSCKSISALRKCVAFLPLLATAIYNSDTKITSAGIIGGNGTDKALSAYFSAEEIPRFTVINKEQFSSDKKYSSVTLSNGITYIKGAPEIILAKSSRCVDSSGKIISLRKSIVEQKLYQAGSMGKRVIAVAYKEKNDEDYIFVSLVILRDMLRRDSRRAIEGIKKAGVQIVMLTGDSKLTAAAIAEECGIITSRERDIVLTSEELSNMTDAEVKKQLPHLRVLARALPQDKTRLIKLSQELDLVVGMTGDGINDAPSLKLADVGFGMGSGVDIAKEAGDIVILDNSLFAINRTILYGRTIFKSIRKFIIFQLIMNLAACGISVFGQLLGVESPITIIQMLWVNIIMDTLGGLAFAGEPALECYMKEKPKKRNEPILTRSMLNQILIMGAFTLSVCLAFLSGKILKFLFPYPQSDLRFLTAFYALFIFLGIFNCFCARSERMWLLSSISKNKPFLLIMLLICVIQIVMIFYGGELFRTVPLSFQCIFRVIALAASMLPFDFIYRFFKRLSKINE